MTNLQLLARAEDRIEQVLDSEGPYKHNLISSILRNVAKKCGNDEANKLIVLFELDAAFGIYPVRGSSKERKA